MPNVLNIAHRGARSLAPENTLAAARKAFELGADMWELDVSVTADGELVVFHDDTLTRLSSAETVFPKRAPWSCHSFTVSELKQLDVGTKFIETDPFGQIAAGAVSQAEQATLRGEMIPTLREALLFTRDRKWQVNVEVKRLPPAMKSFPVIEQVIALIEDLEMVEQVLVSSFAHAYVQQAKVLNPAIATAALSLSPPDVDPLSLVTTLACDAYHPNYAITNNQEIMTLRRAGVDVNVWTVNGRADMERFIEAGVTGIMTDYPQVLSQIRFGRVDRCGGAN